MDKTCRKCNEVKLYSEFYKQSKSKDGYHSYCKSCNHSANRKEVSKRIQKWGKGVYGMFSNGKCLYVGESCIIKNRYYTHQSLLNNPKAHWNIVQPKLYENLRQHNNLIFGIIEQCDNHKEREQYYINKLKPLYNGRM